MNLFEASYGEPFAEAVAEVGAIVLRDDGAEPCELGGNGTEPCGLGGNSTEPFDKAGWTEPCGETS